MKEIINVDNFSSQILGENLTSISEKAESLFCLNGYEEIANSFDSLSTIEYNSLTCNNDNNLLSTN